MANQKLTDRLMASGVTSEDLIHIVITGDTTDSPQGSSYKANIGMLTTLFSGGSSSPISVVNTSSLFSTGLTNTGTNASGVTDSIFFGDNSGYQATDANSSNFIGNTAGYSASDSYFSNFIGYQSGYESTLSYNSNFIGSYAGYQSINSNRSNFIGFIAGGDSPNSPYSNFIGSQTGYHASGATYSNFIGANAGYSASGSTGSNFIGRDTGYNASGSTGSNFIGNQTGYGTTGVSFSNLFGFQVGKSLSNSDSIGSNNIIIGTNITLSAGTTDSINIGGVLFGNGTYSTTSGNPSTGATVNGKIGIGTNDPLETLDVNGSVKISSGGYTNLTNGDVTPVPTGGAGTIVFDTVNLHFFGWNGTTWKQLDN